MSQEMPAMLSNERVSDRVRCREQRAVSWSELESRTRNGKEPQAKRSALKTQSMRGTQYAVAQLGTHALALPSVTLEPHLLLRVRHLPW